VSPNQIAPAVSNTANAIITNPNLARSSSMLRTPDIDIDYLAQ
jgi:hypothetical protein